MTTSQGLLLVMADIDPAAEQDFNRWYEEEHLPERMALRVCVDLGEASMNPPPSCPALGSGFAGPSTSLVPGIHVFLAVSKAWMAGTSPARTHPV